MGLVPLGQSTTNTPRIWNTVWFLYFIHRLRDLVANLDTERPCQELDFCKACRTRCSLRDQSPAIPMLGVANACRATTSVAELETLSHRCRFLSMVGITFSASPVTILMLNATHIGSNGFNPLSGPPTDGGPRESTADKEISQRGMGSPSRLDSWPVPYARYEIENNQRNT